MAQNDVHMFFNFAETLQGKSYGHIMQLTRSFPSTVMLILVEMVLMIASVVAEQGKFK